MSKARNELLGMGLCEAIDKLQERLAALERRVEEIDKRISGCYDDLNSKIAVQDDRSDGIEYLLAEIAPTLTAAPKPAQSLDDTQDELFPPAAMSLRCIVNTLMDMRAEIERLHTRLDCINDVVYVKLDGVQETLDAISHRQLNPGKLLSATPVHIPATHTGMRDTGAHDEELKRHHLDDPQVMEWTIAHHTDEIHALQNHLERVNGILMSLQANNAARFKEIADVGARVQAIEQQQLDIDKLRDRIAALEDERGVRDRIIAEMRARIEALEARTYPLPYVPTWPQYDPRTPPVITKTAGNTGPCCDHRPASHQQGAELHDAGAA